MGLKSPLENLKTLGLIGVGGGVGFSAGVVSGFTMPFRHPIETVKGFKELIVHPIDSSSKIAKQFITDPFGTAGEFYGFGKGLKTITKGVPVKFQYESFGEGGLKTAGFELGYDFIGKRAYPVVSYTPKTGIIGEGFIQPKTSVGTKVFISKISKIITEPTEMLIEGKTISPKLQQEFVIKALESTYELRKVKSKFFTKGALYEQGTKGLTPKEARFIFEQIGKEKGRVFGSFSSMPQLEPSLRRLIGDIEGKFDITSESKLSGITTNILLGLQKTSPRSIFKIKPEEPFHIEKKVKGQFEKVAEFKGEGIGEGDIAPAEAFGYDLWTSKDFAKMDKTMTALLRGELKRKTAGSIMLTTGVKKFSKYQGLTPKEISQGFEFHHTDYLKNEGVVLSKAKHSLIHDFISGKKKPKTKSEQEFFYKHKITAEIDKIPRSLGVAHTGRFKDVPDLLKISESLMKSTMKPTPKAKSFLKFGEEIGIEYKGVKDIKMEILEQKLYNIRSPSLAPSVRSPSPSVRSPSPSVRSPSPSVRSPSPSIMSPSMKSPSVKSPSPSIMSPSMKSPSVKSPSPSVMSPSMKSPSVRSPSPSVKSPSVRSPSPSIAPPSPSIISPPLLDILLLRDKQFRKLKQPKRKRSLAYIPDFTAKVLGITVKKTSQAQLKKLLKKQLTGLELFRPGVVI